MPTTKVQIQYVVIPHPDDEFGAWSLIEGATNNYPVFVLLTHGEATVMGTGTGLQADLGERPPQPQPFHGKGSLFLHAQRLDSWHTFLNRMADLDATLDVPGFRGHQTAATTPPSARSPEFDLFIGDKTARVVFDLGDGHLDADVVSWAVRTVRSEVRPQLPLQQEYGIIGAAYYNASYPGPSYTHPDHHAVHLALWNTDFGLPGPQWGRTPHTDPDAASPHGRTDIVSPTTYEAVMAVGDNGQRLGALQQVYGWLAFEPDGYFHPGPAVTDDGAFARYQSFWQRF